MKIIKRIFLRLLLIEPTKEDYSVVVCALNEKREYVVKRRISDRVWRKIKREGKYNGKTIHSTGQIYLSSLFGFVLHRAVFLDA